MHASARVEDALRRALAGVLRRRGWRTRVLPYTGYGTDGSVRLLARVLLTSRSVLDRSGEPRRGWRSFLALPVPGARVEAVVDGRVHVLASDRGGYVDATVPAGLAPGWHSALLRVGDEGRTASADVRVLDPAARVVVVSDIDDTVMVTFLPRPLLAAWNTFVLREHARRPVPGMAELLRDAAAAHGDAPVLYLSTGAWNVAPTLRRFLAAHGFPPGPLLLTDWGPTTTGWFRDGAGHKREALARLARELPGVRFLLVGDDGQRDPLIYGELADAAPERVLAVAVRELSPAEHALAHGLGPAAGEAAAPPAAQPVAWVTAPDGYGLAAGLRRHGVLPSAPQWGTGTPAAVNRSSAEA